VTTADGLSAEHACGCVPGVTWRDVEDEWGRRIGMVTIVDRRLVAVCAWPCLARIPVPASCTRADAARMLHQHARSHGHGGGR
jgi:hypothetical protein